MVRCRTERYELEIWESVRLMKYSIWCYFQTRSEMMIGDENGTDKLKKWLILKEVHVSVVRTLVIVSDKLAPEVITNGRTGS